MRIFVRITRGGGYELQRGRTIRVDQTECAVALFLLNNFQPSLRRDFPSWPRSHGGARVFERGQCRHRIGSCRICHGRPTRLVDSVCHIHRHIFLQQVDQRCLLRQNKNNKNQATSVCITSKNKNAITHADCFFAPLEIQHVLLERNSQPAL